MTSAQPGVELRDSELSAIYRSADQVSVAGQRITKRLVKTELIALIVASLAGVTVVRVTSHQLAMLFLDRLRNVVSYLQDTKLPSLSSEARELTEAMRRVRRSDVGMRRLVYWRDRIKDQLDWYARRSSDHDKSAKRPSRRRPSPGTSSTSTGTRRRPTPWPPAS